MVTLKIEQHDEDLFIQIPEDILNTLQWQEGDTLLWEVQSDNSISVRKEHQQTNNNWYTVKEEAINEYLESQSEGKEYKDFDEQYEAFLYEHSPEAQGSWNKGNEL